LVLKFKLQLQFGMDYFVITYEKKESDSLYPF
jgi:hypothetical protein